MHARPMSSACLLMLVACEQPVEIDANTAFLRSFEAGLSPAFDSTYGRTEKHAIKLGAPESDDPVGEGRRNRTYFLLSLRGPDGQRVRYTRKGSCCHQPDPHGLDGEAPLDVFEVSYRGIDEPEELYFNVYSFEDPQVPSGFTFRRTVKRKWNDHMWENY